MHLEASGVPYTILRNTFFMQNLLWFAPQIKVENTLPLANWQWACGALIDARDIAVAAAMVLIHGGHDGESFTLSGPESLSFAQVAEEMSAALGRKITFQADHASGVQDSGHARTWDCQRRSPTCSAKPTTASPTAARRRSRTTSRCLRKAPQHTVEQFTRDHADARSRPDHAPHPTSDHDRCNPGPKACGDALLSGRRRLLVLTTISVAVFMVALDVTVVVVALPQIQRQLGLRLEDLQWVVNAYSLSFSAFLMTAGAAADLFGRRRIFVAGIALFSASSLLCGFAASGLELNVARAAQGVGAALMSSGGLALLASLFRGQDRASAFGIWGTVLGLGIAFGPLMGGVITSWFGWHWVFLANIPVGILFGSVALAVIPESRDPQATRIDVAGFVTFTAFLFLLIYALVAGNDRHWSSTILLMLGGAAALLATFVVVERRQVRPMMDLALFASPCFVGVCIAPVALSIGFWALLVFLPLYFTAIEGTSALGAGLALLPLTVPMLILPRFAGAWATRLPSHVFLASGLAVVAVGGLIMAATVGHQVAFLAGMLVTGIGAGTINAEIAKVAVGVVPPERSGMASGIAGTTRQVGFGIGIALLGAVYAATTAASLIPALNAMGGEVAVHAAGLSRRAAAGDLTGLLSTIPNDGVPAVAGVIRTALTRAFTALLLTAAAAAGVGAASTYLLLRRPPRTSPLGSVLPASVRG